MIGIMQGRLSVPKTNLIQEFPWETWENEFSLANKAGFKLIEWTLDYEKIDSNPILVKSQQTKIQRLSESNEIQIKSITLDNFVIAPLHKVNPVSNLTSSVETLFWIIDSLANTTIKILVLPIVNENGGENSRTLSKLIEIMDQIQNKLKANGMYLAIECELDLKAIDYLVRNLYYHENIGFNFDIGNSASLNNNQTTEIFMYGNKLFNVHIKDRMLKGKTVPLGFGNANFKKVFQILKEINYKNNYIIQAARVPNQSEILTSKSYLEFCIENGCEN
jgi:hexulose-6-phosphate isomerase